MHRHRHGLVRPGAGLGLGLCLAWAAHAGWLLEGRLTIQAGGQGQSFRIQALLDGPWIKIVTTPFTGQPSDILFNADTGILRQLYHTDRAYFEVNGRTLQRVGSGMQAAVDYVKIALGRPATNAATAAAAWKARHPGTEQTLAGLRCVAVEWHRPPAGFQEWWLAPWPAAGMTRAEFEPVIRLGRFYEGIMAALDYCPWAAGLPRFPLAGLTGASGYPVQSRYTEAGRPLCALSLAAPKSGPLNAQVFAVPAGYKRVYLPRTTAAPGQAAR